MRPLHGWRCAVWLLWQGMPRQAHAYSLEPTPLDDNVPGFGRLVSRRLCWIPAGPAASLHQHARGSSSWAIVGRHIGRQQAGSDMAVVVLHSP